MKQCNRARRWQLLCLAGAGLFSCAGPAVAQTAFRGVWADAFHPGFKSTAEIDAMVARAKQGNYNAIVAEVLAYKDSGAGGHGAYWNSAILPKAADISGGIDPLAYLCTKAHAEGIEVHAWLVAYRVSTVWPPPNNATLAAHPEWITVPLAEMDTGPQTIGGKYVLDPGSPDVQEYLVSIVRELVTNYPIDGINWDYIRYTQTDAGYPAVASYANSSLARFQRITGYIGTPPNTDSAWQDFRRRTINELVRRCRAEIPAITSSPRQPLRHTADLICSGDAPSVFTSASAYQLFQDWRYWMEMGWLDAGIPMNYKDDRNPTHATWYRNWINAAIGWRYARHMYCGQGNYLNSKANSVVQLQYVYNAGADGSCNYAYYSTADENDDGIEEADFTWYTYVSGPVTGIFTAPVAPPTMPWRNPATATEGTLWGRVTDTAGQPVDDATIALARTSLSAKTDGNGYYVITLVSAGPSGTSYSATAQKSGVGTQTSPVMITRAGLTRRDFALGDPPACPPVILTDFEGYANGTAVMFRQPRYSGSTSGDLALTPNVAEVTDAVPAFAGSKSFRVQWQWIDTDPQRWLRLTTSNTTNKPNPTIWVDRPIRLRLRLDSGSFRLCLGVRETGTTAEIGENGGTTGEIEWIGAASAVNGAPQGRRIDAQPGVWQTVVIDPAREPVLAFTGNGALPPAGTKVVLEHLGFSVIDTAGPFTVYLDEIEQICPPVGGDLDYDGDVDGVDFGVFAACFNGAGSPVQSACEMADLDGDMDIDGGDYGILSACFNGSGNPPLCG